MITRRRFAKAIGSAALVTSLRPGALWSSDASATATPASVPKAATELYHRAFVLDCNALAGIGFPISDDDPVGVLTASPMA